MNTQHSDFITETRQATTQILDGIDKLRNLDQQRVALDLTNQLTEDDFTGANEGLSPADISSITTTLVALEDLLAQGHATNLYKTKL